MRDNIRVGLVVMILFFLGVVVLIWWVCASQAQQINQQSTVHKPRTALGRQLLELRAQIVAAGAPLLDWDGIESDVRERRGEKDGHA